MGDLRWRRGVPPLVAGLVLGSLAVVQVAGSSAAATSARNTGWRVIRTIGPDNTDLESIAAFRHHVPWLGGVAYQPTAGQFYAAVHQLTRGPLHQIPLTTRLGTGLNGLSATSPANVWASVPGVPGGQVYRLTRHGWHPYSFAIAADAQRKHGVATLVLLHWNGKKWSKITGKLPSASLTGAIASDGAGGVWLAAANAADTVPLILRFSHGRWSKFTVPTAKGKPIGIAQLTLIPGTRSVLGTAIIAGSGESTGGTAVIKYGR